MLDTESKHKFVLWSHLASPGLHTDTAMDQSVTKLSRTALIINVNLKLFLQMMFNKQENVW